MSRLVKRRTYSTGDVAQICDVALRTACKWVDLGLLKGYRLPGSRARRVDHEDLLRFLADNGMPIPCQLIGGDRDGD